MFRWSCDQPMPGPFRLLPNMTKDPGDEVGSFEDVVLSCILPGGGGTYYILLTGCVYLFQRFILRPGICSTDRI